MEVDARDRGGDGGGGARGTLRRRLVQVERRLVGPILHHLGPYPRGPGIGESPAEDVGIALVHVGARPNILTRMVARSRSPLYSPGEPSWSDSDRRQVAGARQWWRRQISVSKMAASPSPSSPPTRRQRGDASPPGNAASARHHQPLPWFLSRSSARPRSEANGASTPAFLPVSILNAGAAGQPEIELANACVVRLKGAVDPKLLRIAIRAAGRLGGHGRGGD